MNIDDLVARATAPQRNGYRCWATRTTGDARAYALALHEAIDEGAEVNFAEVSRILINDLGFQIGESAVRNHYKTHTVAELS